MELLAGTAAWSQLLLLLLPAGAAVQWLLMVVLAGLLLLELVSSPVAAVGAGVLACCCWRCCRPELLLLLSPAGAAGGCPRRLELLLAGCGCYWCCWSEPRGREEEREATGRERGGCHQQVVAIVAEKNIWRWVMWLLV
ncbi:hypothetical protein KY284_020485 [Solanum tuberosum]|nr:hypothetical protein KY284_020485 [Solanum tuberosum]